MDIVWNQKTIVGSAVGSRENIQNMLDFSAFYNIQPIVESYSW